MDNRQSDYGWTDVGHWVHLAQMRKLQNEANHLLSGTLLLFHTPTMISVGSLDP